jgi:hypothetical protein
MGLSRSPIAKLFKPTPEQMEEPQMTEDMRSFAIQQQANSYISQDVSNLNQLLKDITDIAAMNEVWDAWVVAGSAPPRATVQAPLANPAYLIEVVVTAAVKA